VLNGIKILVSFSAQNYLEMVTTEETPPLTRRTEKEEIEHSRRPAAVVTTTTTGRKCGFRCGFSDILCIVFGLLLYIGLVGQCVEAAGTFLADDIAATLTTPITSLYDIDSTLVISYDPPVGHFSPSAIGIFVYTQGRPSARIYYAPDDNDPIPPEPLLTSAYCTASSPYIQLNTPFAYGRRRNVTLVAVDTLGSGKIVRSQKINIWYFVEGSGRTASYGFLVPGVESKGIFLGFGIEMNATARAQSSGSNAAIGGQEFADFTSDLG
jgi:hypothetical protein